MKKEDGEEMPEEDGEEGASLNTLELYLEEMKTLPILEKEEEEYLIRKAEAGDRAAKERLTEGNIKYAASFLREFLSGSLSVSDVISEANFALVKSMDRILSDAAEENLTPEKLHEEIAREVRASLAEAEKEKQAQECSDNEIAEKLNRLTEATRILALELGREATTEELAQRMQSTEEEIRAMIKMAGQAMES